MSIHLSAEGTIILEGVCTLEEAESLADLLMANPGSIVDWTACDRLHTAPLQVLLRMRPQTRGTCGDALVARWLATVLSADPNVN